VKPDSRRPITVFVRVKPLPDQKRFPHVNNNAKQGILVVKNLPRRSLLRKDPAWHEILANSVSILAIFLFKKYRDERRVPIAA
jgi:hypothetical protein